MTRIVSGHWHMSLVAKYLETGFIFLVCKFALSLLSQSL